MSRFTKEHYEDVARLLNKQPVASVGSLYQAVKRMGEDFAGLFAADNPKCCIHCGYVKGTTGICDSANGQLRDEHTFEYGFDREQFLAACGLEPVKETH